MIITGHWELHNGLLFTRSAALRCFPVNSHWPSAPLLRHAGQHSVRRDWQQHGGGSPGSEGEREAVPVGHRGGWGALCRWFKWSWVSVTTLTVHESSLPVENPSHCDFVKLRTMLIRTHMHDLKDITNDSHYENYRALCIQNMTRCVCVCARASEYTLTERRYKDDLSVVTKPNWF